MKSRICFLLLLLYVNAFAIIPVYDASAMLQNIDMLANQASQIKNQIDVYNNMIDNTMSLTRFQWDDSKNTINNLLKMTNTIDSFKQSAGSYQAYLDRYQSEEFYKNSPCFNGKKQCTLEEMKRIRQNRIAASVAEKRSRDAMMKGIDVQQQRLKEDASNLQRLQSQAEGAVGQKQALQAAAQLASNQSNQLLQIRALMIAQQNSQAAKDAVKANQEAIKNAGDERFREGSYTKSSGKKW